MRLESFDPAVSDHSERIASLWNRACGADLAIDSGFVRYNLRPSQGARQRGCLAVEQGRPVGWALASVLRDDPLAASPQSGWIDAIAVEPQARGGGVGSALLAWAEAWLMEQGCTECRLGGSLRPFAPGLPEELGTAPFFETRGYTRRAGGAETWDVACDLSDYRPRYLVGAGSVPGVALRAARTSDHDAVLAFMRREFPGRWRYEYEEMQRQNGRMADWIILLTDRGVDGFCRLTFEDSTIPINRFYPCRLPRPWGQLGPIGVSAAVRGHKLGGLVLEAGLLALRERGVRGCVIDWTGLLDFYGRFGFRPHRKYLMLVKGLDR